MKRSPEIPLLPLLVHPPRTAEDRRGARNRIAAETAKTLVDMKLSGVDRRRRTDRRATPRVEVALECEERLPHRRYVRTTKDLSAFGLSLRDGKAHEPGAQVQLALHLPDAMHPLEVRAHVIGPSHGSRGGVRLAFRNPPVESVKRLHRFIRSAL